MKSKQPEINIGLVGHVDHGKTTLVASLTGVWTSRHSEELKRGMTIKLGYAEGSIYYCGDCGLPEAYTPFPDCSYCGSSTPRLLRRVSYVDAPGHEILMATMLSGAAIMDGAILVIAANEKCPQPQTAEHFAALGVIGVRNLVIVQNKVDVVSSERAKKSYDEIREFVKGSWAEDAPIIPVSALKGANIDALLMAVEKHLPTPERELSKPPLMYVARSFDVNKPGTKPMELVGGVVGGSLIQGELRVDDEIELVPGIRIRSGGKEEYKPVTTKVTSLRFGETKVNVAHPGGLLAVGTKLDPSITKGDALVGNVLAKPGYSPPVLSELTIEYRLLERVVGLREMMSVKPVQIREPLMITVGTAITLGFVMHVGKEKMTVRLRRPVAAIPSGRVAFSRQVYGRWRLIGWGTIE